MSKPVTVPVRLTYQKIAAYCLCACGRGFQGFGEEGERKMERDYEAHASKCADALALKAIAFEAVTREDVLFGTNPERPTLVGVKPDPE